MSDPPRAAAASLEHRAEKWEPVFGSFDAATKDHSIEPKSGNRFSTDIDAATKDQSIEPKSGNRFSADIDAATKDQSIEPKSGNRFSL
jgi:hypothetical protein